MRKILFSLCILLTSIAAFAQNGLEGVEIEKYYIYDGDPATTVAPNLPSGAVTYRVYVNLEDGYRLLQVWGNTTHQLVFRAPGGTFWNDTDRGVIKGDEFNASFLNNGTSALDTWVAVGASTSTSVGVLKTEDTDSDITVHDNNDPDIGVLLTVADGNLDASPLASELKAQLLGNDFTSLAGAGAAPNEFAELSATYYSLGGATGPAGSGNKVLIGQFTVTGGELEFELNLQLLDPIGDPVNLWAIPAAGELSHPDLAQTTINLPPYNAAVSVSNSSPFTGETIDFTATADDDDGTIASMMFFVDGNPVGTDNTPGDGFTLENYNVGTSTGTFAVTVIATDDKGATSTVSPQEFYTVSLNQVPTVAFTAPTVLTYEIGTTPSTMVDVEATDNELDPIDRIELTVNSTLEHTYAGGIPTASVPVSGSYNWTFPGDGVYTLTAIAYDASGRPSAPATITVTVTDASLFYSLGGDVYEPCYTRSSFCLPLVAEQDIADITGFDVEINFESAKVTPTGVVHINPAMHDGEQTEADYRMRVEGDKIYLTVFQNATVGTDLNTWGGATGNEILCIEFGKNSNFASEDDVEFSVSLVRESYETGYDDKDGAFIPAITYETFEDTYFRGKLINWADGSPIQGPKPGFNSARIKDGGSYYVEPDANGEFAYDFSVQSPLYPIQVWKDYTNMMYPGATILEVWNGYDSYLTTRVLVNDPGFSPNVYQLIAMDVNLDQKVTAGDVTQINQRAVQLRTEFANSAIGRQWDWAFVAQENLSKSVYTNATKENVPRINDGVKTLDFGFDPDCRFVEPDNFIMILLGDVDGSYSGIAPDGNGDLKSLTVAQQSVIFDLANASYEEHFVDIPVMAASNEAVHSVSFALMFDKEKMEYMSISKLSNVDGLSNNWEDNVWNVSYSVENYNLEEPLFLVRFMVKESFSEDHITLAQGFMNGKKVETAVTKAAPTQVKDAVFADLRIYPNPASDYLIVESATKANIKMIDMNGRVIFSNVALTDKAEINVADLAAGMYFIKIENEKSTIVEKVVIR